MRRTTMDAGGLPTVLNIDKALAAYWATRTTLGVALYKARRPVSNPPAFTDFTECDFTGYVRQTLGAPVAITWPDSFYVWKFPVNHFVCSGDGPAQNSVGYLLFDPSELPFIWAYQDFDIPFPISKNGMTRDVYAVIGLQLTAMGSMVALP